ncbi:unnamed protein product [Linum tenue]|uniref:Oleosin n=1 Tax=Linum tenue TaxID=586396 RepID=A0AAV0N9P1_9ROSI|nr:unnamed protein product [Linum tenue]
MDRTHPHQVQVHSQFPGRYEGGFKGGRPDYQRTGPSASTILAVMTGLPIGGTLLALAGLTLVGTLIGLAVATPVFLICSPVIVPAALTIAFAVTAFLSSGLVGLTGLTSLSWFARYLRMATEEVPGQLEEARKRVHDAAGYVGQKTKEVGQEIQRKAQETKP